MVLQLFQGNVVTKIRIGTGKTDQDPKPVQQKHPVMASIGTHSAVASVKPAVVGLIRKNEQALSPSVRPKKSSLTRLTASQVKEIRENWDATVKACGTKNAAADQLGRIYNCSAKNIYAIIYRYSWANV